MSNRHDSWFAALAGRKAPATLDEHLAAAAKRAHEADTQAALDAAPDEARRRRLVNLYEASLQAGERRDATPASAAAANVAAAGRGGSAAGRGWALGQIGAAAVAGVVIALLGLQLLKPTDPYPASGDPALAKGGSAASASAAASQAAATHQVVATPQPEAAARQLAKTLAEAGVTADVQADGPDAWRLEAALTPEQADKLRPALAARGLELAAGGGLLRARFVAL